MKCQRCDKQATFHITELTGAEGYQELHLCADHAQKYLAPSEEGPPAPAGGGTAPQVKVGQTAEELEKLDQRACPVCGITFFEFRHQGRLGCPHDYDCFASELEPLILNIHGESKHIGKRPRRQAPGPGRQTELIRLRREMKDAIGREDYERASQLRDQIRGLEQEGRTP